MLGISKYMTLHKKFLSFFLTIFWTFHTGKKKKRKKKKFQVKWISCVY